MSINTKTHPDQSLVAQIARADRATVEQVYRECLGPVINYVTKNSGDEDEARDIFQEGLTIVFNQARAEKLVLTASLSTYINAICRKLWLKQLRKKSTAGVTFEEEPESKEEETITEALTTREKTLLYREKFSRLGEDCQKLMGLFFDKTPMAEIVDLMGFSSISYAKKRKFQCKEKLVSMIKEDPLYAELTN